MDGQKVRRDVQAAFLSTDQATDLITILQLFVRRWSIESTFAEVRRHLGVETQRQWSDLATACTTPCLLALFSLVMFSGSAASPRGLILTQARSLVCQARYHLLGRPRRHPTPVLGHTVSRRRKATIWR